MRVSALVAQYAALVTTVRSRQAFRDLESISSSSLLPAAGSFVFDGTNSDFARQLYIRHKAGDTGDAVSLTSVPAAVKARLDPLNVKFDDLPGLVQRAVLWDSGFGVSPNNEAVQVWPIDNHTMADIAIPKAEVGGAGCTFKNCSQPNDVIAYFTLICSGDQMLSVARCVADTFEDDGAAGYLGAMWSNGADPDMAPQIRLRDHSWTDPVSNHSYSVYAVHTVPTALDVAWNQCPASDEYASVAVPCHRRDSYSDEEIAAMTAPTGSAWVTAWLNEEFAKDVSSFNLLMVVLIALGIVLMAAIGLGWYCWRRRLNSKPDLTASPECDLGADSTCYLDGGTPEVPTRPTTYSTRPTTQLSCFSHLDDYESAGSNMTLKILLNSVHLQGRRIPIVFTELPGLVQRAVLWDTGFAISPSNDPVQIWTMDDYTMADLAVPKDDVSGEGCTFKNCSQPNDVTAYYTLICSGDQMLNVSRCVADTFEDSAATSYMGSMWSVGGDPDMLPQLRLRNHAWEDPVSNASYSVYAVHTVSNADDPAWNVCPTDDGYAALTVPCHRRDEYTDAEMAAMTKPTGSAWVTTWLEEEFGENSGGFDMLLLIPIILGTVVVVAAAGIGWFCWRKRAKKSYKRRYGPGELEDVGMNYFDGGTPVLALANQVSTIESSGSCRSGSAGSNTTLQILLDSTHLLGKRIPYDSLTFQTALSKGASGEVWICQYNGRTVAGKKLLGKNQKAKHVQSFAEEIELSASLVHPNIVEFIGVAWNSLNNLVMVIEYVPMGSLRKYLKKNADLLSMTHGHTINLRSLVSTSSLPSNSSFVFDGTNSDIAQQLYIRHKAGDTDAKLSLNSVPTAVIKRLDPLSIVFTELPGLVQRAVLWDTGFAISPSNDPVQIWTMDDYTMADLAVPKDDVSGEGCTFKNCSQPNDVTAYYTLICSGDQMLNVSRCVADTFEDSAATSYMGSMWSVGGDPDMLPQLRLRDHAWEDPVTKDSYSVYAIHTVSNADDPAWNVCPADDGYAALAVPCHRRDEFTDAEMAAMTKPTGSAWVTTWLKEEFGKSSGFDKLLLVPIILGTVVLVAGAGIELDTGRIPYHDALTEGGGKAKPVQILQDVVCGTLRPTFTNDCPPRILRVGSACLAQDPLCRPTAEQLIQELRGRDNEQEYAL
ncbi:TKL/DRK protein kinase [Phytophthora cinnamomi]|uniref:TKL/DRK protein kinase n=1 Tax=Phytophthora cinnamomi TaxID=4785 RepID=UPI003559FE1B|nr:TKL/DRK protein kinase [Phytophthora cinnamomi]